MTLPQVHGEYGVVMEPELKFNDAGGAWLKMRCKATSRKQVDGVWVDGDILFIDILASKKLAENTFEMVQRGSTITVSGTLKYREWESNEGEQDKKVKASNGTATTPDPWETPQPTEAPF
jgi:single-stranded DNA-binding protein